MFGQKLSSFFVKLVSGEEAPAAKKSLQRRKSSCDTNIIFLTFSDTHVFLLSCILTRALSLKSSFRSAHGERFFQKNLLRRMCSFEEGTSNEAVRSKECFALRRMWSFEEGALQEASKNCMCFCVFS